MIPVQEPELPVPLTRRQQSRFFHGWFVLGNTGKLGKSVRDSVVKALFQSIDEQAIKSFCFEPRHAIRAIEQQDTVDLIICFECSQFVWDAHGERGGGSISETVAPLLNELLKLRGIPIAPP